MNHIPVKFIFIVYIWQILIILIFMRYLSNHLNVINKFDNLLANKNHKNYSSLIDNSLKSLPGFEKSVNCSGIFHRNQTIIENSAKWVFSEKKYDKFIWKTITSSSNSCAIIKKMFGFLENPLSEEEKNFPLAYAILIHRFVTQIYFMMASIYQPQNLYCIAVDGNSDPEFQKRITLLTDCFPNIIIIQTRPVKWCGFQIVRSVFRCLHLLTKTNHPWKQFQYMSGVDLTLKTNLEMVRIFKALNGAFMADIEPYDFTRLLKERRWKVRPLPLWKSSLSATFSRESANYLIKNNKVKKLYRFLKPTLCADETIWATIAGNPDYIKMPGGFDAAKLWTKIEEQWPEVYKTNKYRIKIPTADDPFPLYNYYISRYQVWRYGLRWKVPGGCRGKYVLDSCVYGVGDLPRLIVRPELVAHKLYLSYQPATFFCLYERVRKRALDTRSQKHFNADQYSTLPQVQLLKGKNLNDLKFFYDLN